jgi:hypothetical protein
MKPGLRAFALLVTTLAAAGGLITAYLEMRGERDREASAEAPVVAPSRLERDTNGQPFLRLEEKTESLLGLRTARPARGSVARELAATARVLDAATVAAQWTDLRSAQASLEAARADAARKEKLYAEGRNATASAVEQAKALLQQQELQADAARQRLLAAWGEAIAGRADLPEFSRRLLNRSSALVRLDLPPTGAPATLPPTARLVRPDGSPLASIGILGPAPATDIAVAGGSLLGLVETNANLLVPGSILGARLPAGTALEGVVLPLGAVVRHAGLGWAYVETAPHTFTRRAVPLDQPHPEGWLVTGDWPQPVLVAGAQSLLSEELKGGIEMKD